MTQTAQALRFDVVDVFADRPFSGNPLAVVHGAEGLDSGQLQRIAREFNLSETVFPLAPTASGASYRARIFTPDGELPFAGHPSVGVAWVLARDGVIGHGDAVQECGAGLLPVRVDATGARIWGGTPSVGAVLDGAELARAVGLTAADLDPVAPAGVAGAGLDFPVLPVRADAVARAVGPDAAALNAVAGGQRGRVLVVHLDLAARRVHARMFGAGVGVYEDPATGSASIALAVYVADRGLLGDGESGFTVEQGIEMGRPSRLEVEVTVVGRTVSSVSVGGRVFPISRGEIAVPPADSR